MPFVFMLTAKLANLNAEFQDCTCLFSGVAVFGVREGSPTLKAAGVEFDKCAPCREQWQLLELTA